MDRSCGALPQIVYVEHVWEKEVEYMQIDFLNEWDDIMELSSSSPDGYGN